MTNLAESAGMYQEQIFTLGSTLIAAQQDLNEANRDLSRLKPGADPEAETGSPLSAQIEIAKQRLKEAQASVTETQTEMSDLNSKLSLAQNDETMRELKKQEEEQEQKEKSNAKSNREELVFLEIPENQSRKKEENPLNLLADHKDSFPQDPEYTKAKEEKEISITSNAQNSFSPQDPEYTKAKEEKEISITSNTNTKNFSSPDDTFEEPITKKASGSSHTST